MSRIALWTPATYRANSGDMRAVWTERRERRRTGTTLAGPALYVFDAAQRAAEDARIDQGRLQAIVACVDATPADVAAALRRCRRLRMTDPIDGCHAAAVLLLEGLLSTMDRQDETPDAGDVVGDRSATGSTRARVATDP